eukprot:TRINITY_DN1006_c0_g1_i1.p1 TRINITY_DN1006_c0_g1~~TRINITY_DN1006_c0_g1_i1.p1  ORF type:complete len:397 (-),score=98.64 TRINITY_DN1006_c0_g1_i1:264-1454(-)
MKFGKRLQIHLEETLPEWRDKFLSYKPLKKRLKQLSAPECFTAVGFCAISPTHDGSSTSVVDTALQELRKGNKSDGGDRTNPSSEAANLVPSNVQPEPAVDNTDEASSQSSVHTTTVTDKKAGAIEEEEFINLINEELEKFNNFFLEKEEEYVISLQELKERIERLKETSKQNGCSTSKNEFNEETVKIRRDIVAIHGEMILLENYSALNFTGLVKILKKYDKRTGALLRLPFIQNVLKQPFFTTELLSKLVHECEANLQSIFPSQPVDQIAESSCTKTDIVSSHMNSQEALRLQGDTADSIYRSTLAALRTIKDLRKGSSTYNPLSFASFAPGDVEDSWLGEIRHKDGESPQFLTTTDVAQEEENTVPEHDDRSQAAIEPNGSLANGEQKEVSVP